MSTREPYRSILAVVTAIAAFCTACSNSEPRGGSPARPDAGTGSGGGRSTGGAGGLDASTSSGGGSGASDASPSSGGATSSGGTSTGGAPLRVLFIGNSYTAANDLPAVVRALGANTPGAAVEAESILVAGAMLYDHWVGPVAQARIASKEFDAVVVQGQSTEPLVQTVAFEQYAALFSGAIHDAGARGVWFATWARAEGDAMYKSFGTVLRDPVFMTQQLDFRYALAAKLDDDTLARVGAAFRIAHGAYPDVPLYIEDGSHPSPEGSLLAACVLLPALTGREAILPEPPPLGVPRDVATALCSIVPKIDALEPTVPCGGDMASCGGECVDVLRNPDHCGDCDRPCAPSDPCEFGKCGCRAGYTGCDRACFNLLTSRDHCGDCDTSCTGGADCTGGICGCRPVRLLEYASEDLAAVKSACGPPDAFTGAACAAAIRIRCEQYECFDSGFAASGHAGGSVATISSLACVAGDVHQATYAALQAFSPACDGVAERRGQNCATAIHRHCVSRGAVTGFGGPEGDGDAVTVTCLPAATLVRTTAEELRKHASRCVAEPYTCSVASWGLCEEKGHLAGFGPVEVAGTDIDIACVDR